MDANQTPMVYIYALSEPSGPIRYVGQSVFPWGRLANHALVGSGRVVDWIAKLKSEGKEPQLVILDQCSKSEADDRERYWIGQFSGLLNAFGVPEWKRPKRVMKRHVHESAGRDSLLRLCAKRGMQTTIAMKLSGDRGASVVNRWVKGRQKPDAASRLELQRLYGIPITAWDEPAKKASAA